MDVTQVTESDIMVQAKHRSRSIGFVAMAGLLLATRLGVCGGPGAAEGPRGRAGGGADVDAELPRLVLIRPGTSVAGELPAGWTHRAIRSVPRAASGELDTLPASGKETAALLRTVVLAEVARSGGRFGLRRVGVGNAVPHGGRELAVDRDGPAEVREGLGTVAKIVVGVADDELRRGRIIARTPTFALYRTPAKLVIGGAHAEVGVHYALLVDPATGALQTLAWASRPGVAPPRRAALLPPDFTFDCALDVAVSTRLLGIPAAWSFAMAALPDGRPIELPPTSSRLLGDADAGKADPVALERSLRAAIDGTVGR